MTSQFGFDPDRGTDAPAVSVTTHQANQNRCPLLGIVPVQKVWIFHGRDRRIQIAIPVEVRQGQSVTYSGLVEAPFAGNLGKRNPSQVAEDEVFVFLRRRISPKVSLCLGCLKG